VMLSVVVRQGVRLTSRHVSHVRNVTFGAPPPPKGGPIIMWIRKTKVFKWFIKTRGYRVICNENVQRFFYWTVQGTLLIIVGLMFTKQMYKFRDLNQNQSASMMTPSQMKYFGNNNKQEETEAIMTSLLAELDLDEDLDDWENVRYPRKEEPETVLLHNRREEERNMLEIEQQVQTQLAEMKNDDFTEEDFQYIFDEEDEEE